MVTTSWRRLSLRAQPVRRQLRSQVSGDQLLQGLPLNVNVRRRRTKRLPPSMDRHILTKKISNRKKKRCKKREPPPRKGKTPSELLTDDRLIEPAYRLWSSDQYGRLQRTKRSLTDDEREAMLRKAWDVVKEMDRLPYLRRAYEVVRYSLSDWGPCTRHTHLSDASSQDKQHDSLNTNQEKTVAITDNELGNAHPTTDRVPPATGTKLSAKMDDLDEPTTAILDDDLRMIFERIMPSKTGTSTGQNSMATCLYAFNHLMEVIDILEAVMSPIPYPTELYFRNLTQIPRPEDMIVIQEDIVSDGVELLSVEYMTEEVLPQLSKSCLEGELSDLYILSASGTWCPA